VTARWPPRDASTTTCVYDVRIARVNVYLPEELAREAREAGLNVSALTRDALRDALAARRGDAWLDDVLSGASPAVPMRDVIAAAADAKDDLERGRE
jgi:post-segregation antitoxin (ccd killing protein)